MIQNIKSDVHHEVQSLVSDIGYRVVPDWYDGSYRELKMHLIIPKHRENHSLQPCLLFICGGAYSVVNGGIWLPEMLYFARHGYTVATIDYRTSNQAIFPAALQDAKCAVRFLKMHAAQFCIDPAKIIVAGESAGGTLAALVGVTGGIPEFEPDDYSEFDSSVAAVVDFYGPVDLIASGNTHVESDTVDSWALEAFLGAGYGEETAIRASALHYVGAGTPPFMILHGTNDKLVDIAAQSDRMYDALVQNGVKAEYIRLEGAEHGDDAFYQEDIKARILNFMNGVIYG